jgi:hypothetical protein
MCPISDGYGVTTIFLFPYTPSCEPNLRNQLVADVLKLVAYRLRCKHYFCHLTRAVHNRAAVAAVGAF